MRFSTFDKTSIWTCPPWIRGATWWSKCPNVIPEFTTTTQQAPPMSQDSTIYWVAAYYKMKRSQTADETARSWDFKISHYFQIWHWWKSAYSSIEYSRGAIYTVIICGWRKYRGTMIYYYVVTSSSQTSVYYWSIVSSRTRDTVFFETFFFGVF